MSKRSDVSCAKPVLASVAVLNLCFCNYTGVNKRNHMDFHPLFYLVATSRSVPSWLPVATVYIWVLSPCVFSLCGTLKMQLRLSVKCLQNYFCGPHLPVCIFDVNGSINFHWHMRLFHLIKINSWTYVLNCSLLMLLGGVWWVQGGEVCSVGPAANYDSHYPCLFFDWSRLCTYLLSNANLSTSASRTWVCASLMSWRFRLNNKWVVATTKYLLGFALMASFAIRPTLWRSRTLMPGWKYSTDVWSASSNTPVL